MSISVVEKTVAEKSTPKKKVAAKKKTAAKKPKTETDLIHSTAHSIENLKKDAAYKMAKSLSEDVEFSYFKLGGVLSVIQTNAWFTEDGYESFKDFVEGEFGIQYRKSMYLISIYNGLVEAGIPWSKVKDLGWTKLKELVHVINPDNVDDWVAKAKEMTVLQLQEAIKAEAAGAKVKPGEGSETKVESVTTWTVKLHEDQREVIMEAVESAKKQVNSEHNAVALEAICMNFLNSGKAPAAPAKSPLDTMKELGWEAVLEIFGEAFDDEDIEVTVVVGSGEKDAA